MVTRLFKTKDKAAEKDHRAYIRRGQSRSLRGGHRTQPSESD